MYFRFNRKPKQGLKFLQERNLVGASVDDIARFFHAEDRLDKVLAIGNTLFCRQSLLLLLFDLS